MENFEMKKLLNSLIIGTIALGIGQPARAISIFYGEDLGAGGSFVPNGNAVQAQNDFLSQLSGISTEDFENFIAKDTGPLDLIFTGSAGTIKGTLTSTGSGLVRNRSYSGSFPTSGNQFWATTSQFSINFDKPIVAFGFFFSDFEQNPLTLELGLVEGGTQDISTSATVPASNGALAYFGLINMDNPFTSATFVGATKRELYGFDDLTVSDLKPAKTVPEPSTVLGIFMALGLGALFQKKEA
ncbi:MAG: PEP-CTERM sorting domain-containing protein [Trichodesmium sp. St16_bin4-tuft]|uniref:PEP motif putative anchor-like n=1 Tax=Trichodesmium erythraeum (strain IMS101) TaxID=203124 RepID=Q10XL8_TRIEI|nr:PEP-CTERM sorting domain-containing protein [Trichodesmium erythraeum GBRTRLIN201]MDE5073592.1 PEP-CTERM sorting domain-containing protein [Trichodesmium sp. St5_bin8]MDE5078561.1 PEP-CTERM sorting domain-containing protein [Trichodesmium sp. St2_bin6]MDE5100640.1 PEP-CTERM sorting domain-containing protein [Trichodesmium sp. St16_bin4-tuft]MDT9337941.1 PEP-CTERM sorting domain-containing protein [Trichodesmium erythraeum 21-75]